MEKIGLLKSCPLPAYQHIKLADTPRFCSGWRPPKNEVGSWLTVLLDIQSKMKSAEAQDSSTRNKDLLAKNMNTADIYRYTCILAVRRLVTSSEIFHTGGGDRILFFL